MPSKAKPVIAALVIAVVTLVVYRDVLFPPSPAERYPWSSDAWGHLIKADYLQDQISEGSWYPDLFPDWYNGQQMLRYYAPLPYYGLVGLFPVTDDTFDAGNWFLFLSALGGGLSMLLFSRRFGLPFATIGGVLLVLLPDNIRVAFAEGNLPRVLAAALLPVMFYFLLNLLTEERNRKLNFVGLAAFMALIVLSHAMMGAIFGASLSLFVIAFWLIARGNARYARETILALFTGVLLSGWWLLPSLTGGITDLNADAVTEALASFPASVTFNPVLRLSDKEIFYVGASFLVMLGLVVIYWRRLDGLIKTLVVIGIITGLISSTLINVFYNALPYHQLFWPIRFMTFAGFILTLSTVALISQMWKLSGPRRESAGRFLAIGLMLVMLADFWQSTPLIETRQAPSDVLNVAESLRDSSGWRVATTDLSLLGSSPSYLFSEIGGKEQVYGWAFQGATTGPLLAQINHAIENDYSEYAVDRLNKLGADDVVVIKNRPNQAFTISSGFREMLVQEGYEKRFDVGRVDVYHREGSPRAFKVDTSVIAIGSGAQNLALIFPDVVVASDPKLDSYDLEFLADFDTILLTGFEWNSKDKAEQLARDLVSRDKHVIVDFTGTPLETLPRIPKFLDVFGERILIGGRITLDSGDSSRMLAPFDAELFPWQSFVPQGLDGKEITFDYNGISGVVLGSKNVGDGTVDYLGLNLVYHSVRTRDPVGIDILERELGIRANVTTNDVSVELTDYLAGQEGFTFSLDAPDDGYYLIPVARNAGTRVFVDGEASQSWAIDNLTMTKLTAGIHQIVITSEQTTIYPLGVAVTALGGLIIVGFMLTGLRLPSRVTSFTRGIRVPAPLVGVKR